MSPETPLRQSIRGYSLAQKRIGGQVPTAPRAGA